MICPDCDREIHGAACTCGWVKPGASNVSYRSTEHALPDDSITKKEFGLDLYRALECVGGIQTLRNYRAQVAMGYMPQTDEYKIRESKLIEEFNTVLVRLKACDVTDLTKRYPWIVTL